MHLSKLLNYAKIRTLGFTFVKKKFNLCSVTNFLRNLLIVTDDAFDCNLLRNFVAFVDLASKLLAVQQSNILVLSKWPCVFVFFKNHINTSKRYKVFTHLFVKLKKTS